MSKHTREDSPKQWRQWKQYGSSELRNLWLQMQEGLPALPQPSSPAAHTCITMQPSSNVHCGGVFPRISEALCSLAGVGSGNHACYVLCRQDRGRAGQGRAEQGRAGQGRAGQGRAGQGRAGQGTTLKAGQSKTRQGTTKTEQGKAWQGRAGHDLAWPWQDKCRARQGMTRKGRTRQNQRHDWGKA